MRKDHGQVFAEYVGFLIRSRTVLRDKITRHVNRFRANAAGRADGIVYADIIRKFGLIYAGGALAIEGVGLSWKRANSWTQSPNAATQLSTHFRLSSAPSTLAGNRSRCG